jgi:CubicO group peptidase (beta-lactamase class C family)
MRNQVLKIHLLLLALAAPAAAQTTARSTPPEARPAPLSNEQLAAAADEHMRRLVPFGYNGSLLLERNGQVLLSRGYGSADPERGTPFTAETPFYIGSLTKQFTAAGILKLEMEGRLRVTDSIGRFFPDAPADKRGITLHHLMTHSSGLRDTPGGLDSLRTREQVVRDILADSLRSVPGATYVYSNAGYTLLGAVVEVAAGMPFEQYLRDRLWTPAGMRRTGYRPPDVRAEEVAIGYQDGERWGNPLERQRLPDGPTWSLRGAGGMISTLQDMLAWKHALDGTAILSAEAKAKMWTPHIAENAEGTSHYGYGWALTRTSRNTNLVWHNGSNGIYYAEMRIYPDEGVVMIISSNVAEAMAELALPGVVRLTFGIPYTPPPAAESADPARAAAAAGTYRLATGGTITVTAQDGRLRLRPEGQDAYAVAHGHAPAPALESIARRTVALLDSVNRGEFEGLRRAMNGGMTLDEIGQMNREFMEEMDAGAPVGVDLLGAVLVRGRVEVVTRIRFERGAGLVRVYWRDGELVGMQVMEELPETVFLPAADGTWVSYDLQSAETVRLRIENGALVADTPSGPVRATRGE